MMVSVRASPAHWSKRLFGIGFDYVDPWGETRVYEQGLKLLNTPFRMRPECRGASAAGSGHQTCKTEMVKVWSILWMMSHYPAFVIVVGDTWPAVLNKILPGIKARAISANRRVQEEFSGMIPDEMIKALSYFEPKSLPDKSQWEWGPEWGIYGFAPLNPEPLQGYHAQGKWGGTLVIADEANALPVEFLEPLKVYSKNPRNYVMFLGNPTSQDSSFSCILRKEQGYEGWDVFNLSSWNTPNATGTRELIERGQLTVEEALNGKEFIAEGFEGLATYSYCYEQQKKHPNIYHPRVLGLPPEQSDETWISRRVVTECGERGRRLFEGGKLTYQPKRLRLLVDPATSDFGDEAVFLLVDPDQKAVIHREAHLGWDDAKKIGHMMNLCMERRSIFEIRIEADGIGKPLADRLSSLLESPDREDDMELRRLRDRLLSFGRIPAIDAVRVGGKPHDEVMNVSRKAENWRTAKIELESWAIPPEMIDHFYEISKMRFDINARGQLKIEEKKDFKKRGNKSPNTADAFMLEFSRPVGDPLFGILERQRVDLQMRQRPKVLVGDAGAAKLYYEALGPEVYSRDGKIARAWWYSRRTESAVVWVHVDAAGNWCVFDCLTVREMHLEEFTKRVYERSFDEKGAAHRYALDACSASEASAKIGPNLTYADVIDSTLRHLSEARRYPKVLSPWAEPPALISGTAGLDVLDRLVAGTASGKPPLFVSGPEEVARAMENARFRQPGANADPEEDQVEEGVAGGGAIVRALRLVAVSGIR